MNCKRCLAVFILMCIIISCFTVNAFAITRSNQTATAYVASGDRMANGEWPEIGDVAVHPSTRGGSKPIIPFGTFLYVESFTYDATKETTEFVPSPEGELTVLRVGDLGDVKYAKHPSSTYWVDLYWGDDISSARKVGNSKITYQY